MLKPELKDKITNMLDRMNCKDVSLSNGEDDKAVARFNCEIVISFKADLEGWTYSGIQLNDPEIQAGETPKRKYKIEFTKIK